MTRGHDGLLRSKPEPVRGDPCRGDAFVSARALRISAGDRQDEIWRLRFSDDFDKNLWALTLRPRSA